MISKILETLGKKQKVLSGLVISKTHTKTALCMVKKLHFDKGKYASLEYKRTKYMIHDPEDQCDVGDQVHFVECAPISKRKTHRLTRIVKKNEAIDFIKQNPQYIVTPNEISKRKEQDRIRYTHIADL